MPIQDLKVNQYKAKKLKNTLLWKLLKINVDLINFKRYLFLLQ